MVVGMKEEGVYWTTGKKTNHFQMDKCNCKITLQSLQKTKIVDLNDVQMFLFPPCIFLPLPK